MAGADADNPPLYSVLSNAAPTAGKWTLVTGVYNSATRSMSMYVDGVQQTATASVTGAFNATSSVTIGKRLWNGADDSFFAGAIDDVRIYSFAETPAKLTEISQPLSHGRPSCCAAARARARPPISSWSVKAQSSTPRAWARAASASGSSVPSETVE